MPCRGTRWRILQSGLEETLADFTKLDVWQMAHAFTLSAYQFTARFPADERFGLIGQVRRAAVSIGANIAEGCGRFHKGDQARFLQMAKGSAKETRSHLIIARDLGFMTAHDHQAADSQLERLERMLSSLIRTSRNG